MKNAKKLLALLLALLLCLALLPATALAEGPDGNGGQIRLVETADEPEEDALDAEPSIKTTGVNKAIGTQKSVEAIPGEPVNATEYGLIVAGTTVTDENMSDILGDGGTFVFDGDHTLTVSGSCRASTSLINNLSISGLVIEVAADATLENTYTGTAITVKADTTITGKGKLTLVAPNNCGIYATGTLTLTIKDAYVDVTGYWGISGNSSISSEALLIDNAIVIASGGAGAICDFGAGVALKSCEILIPEGGTLSSSAVVDAEGNEVTYAVISNDPNFDPPALPVSFDLTVDGTTVTDANMNDILGDGGTFVFDGDHTLTVNGSYTSSVNVIRNKGIEGLVINVAANATLESTNSAAIAASADTTITGKGKLTLKASDCAVYASGTLTLTIKDAYVDATGYWGISGYSTTSDEALLIDHATVIASGSAGAICDFGAGVTVNNCTLVLPDGGSVGDYAIVDGEGADATEAFIAVNPFVDVQENNYFFRPVMWAFYHDPQVTKGTDTTHFGPGATCTREQIVTFLWKACGAPEPTSTDNPFTDVKSGDYFYKAVLWAVENKVTKGVDATHFGVGQPCTREQAMTFLWKAVGAPEPTSTDNPFTDVPATAYYFKPILWAVENGVTKGVSADSFGVGQPCTRAQIVTFLYKALG